jgi:hypothetical protein
MAKFKLSENKILMSLYDIVKYQILTYCYTKKIAVIESELDCLTVLAMSDEMDLGDFCLLITNKRIFKSLQAVRNCIVKLEKNELLIKKGRINKTVKINPKMQILSTGNIMTVFKFIHLDTNEVERDSQKIN